MTETDTTMPPKVKPVKKAAKRSKTSCGCKDKNGCKPGVCGCSVNARECSESCGCATHEKCYNSFGSSYLGNKTPDQSSMSNNNDVDKENADVIPCTPPKKKRLVFFLFTIYLAEDIQEKVLRFSFYSYSSGDDIINPYVYSQKKRNPLFTDIHWFRLHQSSF